MNSMPLHLNSFTDDYHEELFHWVATEAIEDATYYFDVKDKTHLLFQKVLTDTLSGDPIGRIVYLLKINKDNVEILDLDIVIDNEARASIQLLSKREESDESNEYYEAEPVNGRGHFIIETVNRLTIAEEINEKELDVSISIFPFELTVFEDMKAFNAFCGLTEPRRVGNTDLMVHGFSSRFIMPGGIFESKKREQPFSMLIGEVLSFRDACFEFGKRKLPFVLAMVDTAIGTVPIVMGREVFDLSKLKEGCIVGMNANIKADLSSPDAFTPVRALL